ncbi:chemotaxis protein CheW [Terriglobus tenax]|uniref:chemotaxis protein CheW n=1 Tax=Terriglobus tenax TaxID=1111115 RepID=UPI0021E0F90E|nr:chemotaxis protein CheW [Terriglobus tenax]
MATKTNSRAVQVGLDTSRKHLIFSLGDEEFGIQVLNIKEIIQMQEVTAVPKTPVYVKGVINLRGQVIPVLDLSVRFSIPQRQYTAHTCIVVVRLASPMGERLIGAVADGVSEVLSISEEDIEPSPDFGNGTAVPYLLGMAKVRGSVKLLLDTDKVFCIENTADLN